MLISGDISFDIDIDIKLISRELSIFGRLSLSLVYLVSLDGTPFIVQVV